MANETLFTDILTRLRPGFKIGGEVKEVHTQLKNKLKRNMKLGNVLEKIFKYTGIKWLVEKIVIDLLGYKSCGCDKRKEKLNHIKIDLWN